MNKKNYRKFTVSTMAATAAVAAVAPAVSAAEYTGYPDVPTTNDHYEAIKALTEQGVIQGYENGDFGVWDSVTRGQVAVMLAGALDIPTPENVADVLKAYDDVDVDTLYAEDIAAVTEAGIFNGDDGEFNPADDITREQMATALYLGFDLDQYDNGEDVDANLDNVSPSHLDRVQTLLNLDISNQVDSFAPAKAISRGAFSTMVYLSQQVVAPIVVDSVSAVTSLVDDNTSGQFVEFAINGSSKAADMDALEEAGYTVEFQSTNNIFAALDEDGKVIGTSVISSTGQLQDSLTADKTYSYKVVVSNKDGEVVAKSDLTEFKVEDLNSQYVSIDSYDLTAGDLTLKNSTTALVGEKVQINDVDVTTKAGKNEESISSYSVKSSDPTVAYVSAQGELTTLKAGTTTVTITAGETTETFTLTVSADENRNASTVTVDPASTKLVANDSTEKSIDLEVTDQFGEAYSGEVYVKLPTTKVDNTDVDLVDLVSSDADPKLVTITNGEGSFTVTGAAQGQGNVVVLDEKDGEQLASVAVDVTEDTEVASRALEIVGGKSDDLTIDSYAIGSDEEMVNDSTVNLALDQYNEAGFYIGKEAITKNAPRAEAYTVQVTNNTDANVEVGDNEIVVTAGEETGSVQVVVSYGGTVLTKKDITVNNSTPEIESVNFKSAATITEADQKVNASTVLSYDEETGLVSGLDITTNEDVYFSNNTNTLYVEKDGEAGLTEADEEIGSLSWIADSGLTVTADKEYITQAGDEGNVIFTLEDAADKDVDNTAVAVDVPAE